MAPGLAVEWPPEVDSSFVPVQSQSWDRTVEMDPGEREQLVLFKLKAQLAYCYAKSGFYREKWDAAGVDPSRISSLAELRRLPLLRKQELRSEQADPPPFGRYLCVPREHVLRIHGTSGTTGRPTAFGVSRGDWRHIACANARITWGAGIRPTDWAPARRAFLCTRTSSASRSQ